MELKARVIARRALGEKAASIAESEGLPLSRVYRYCKKPKSRERFRERNDEIRKLAEKYSYSLVGEKYGISRQRVHKIVKRAEKSRGGAVPCGETRDTEHREPETPIPPEASPQGTSCAPCSGS